jgi:hypothetical protein
MMRRSFLSGASFFVINYLQRWLKLGLAAG